MKASSCILFFAIAFFAVASLRAQVPPTGGSANQPIPPPPTPPNATNTPTYPTAPYGYGSGYDYDNPSPHLAAAVTFPYAFKFDSVGVSGELGGLVNHNFFGAEVTWFGTGDERFTVFDNNNNVIGHFRTDQDVTTVEFAYRYFVPLYRGTNGWTPATFYIGGGAGAGFVDYNNDGRAFGFHSDNDTAEPAAEGVAGFQFNAGRNVSLRVGYRYIDISHVWQYDHHTNLESNVAEAGLAFRF
jgi:opacity protein-like surface antigen